MLFTDGLWFKTATTAYNKAVSIYKHISRVKWPKKQMKNMSIKKAVSIYKHISRIKWPKKKQWKICQ